MGRQGPPSSSYTPSNLPSDWRLVELGAPQGSNAFLCVDDAGQERLVEMGGKLRRMVYASRGSFAMVRLYPSSPTGPATPLPSEATAKGATSTADAVPDEKQTGSTSRLAGEIMSVVTPDEMKQWKRSGEWPKAFSRPQPSARPPVGRQRQVSPGSGSDSDSDNAPVPMRRRVLAMPPSDSESDEE